MAYANESTPSKEEMIMNEYIAKAKKLLVDNGYVVKKMDTFHGTRFKRM